MTQTLDAQIGIYGYAAPFRGVGGRVRASYRDFKVEEVLAPEAVREISGKSDASHRYPIYLMVKEGVDTLHALMDVKRLLKCPVTYLGLKDARAQTAQFICVKRWRGGAPEQIPVTSKVSLSLTGYSSSILTRRSLAGNRFTVKITGITEAAEVVKEAEEGLRWAVDGLKMANFYGYQRFGSKRPVTHLVGREIVKGRLGEAVNILLTYPSIWEDDETVEARRELADPAKYSAVVKRLKWSLDIERSVVEALIVKGGDWLNALRRIPLPLRRLFINSYQSYIFNRAASEAVREGLSLAEVEAGDLYGEVEVSAEGIRRIAKASTRLKAAGVLPMIQLVGYAYRGGGGRLERMVQSVLEEEGVSPKQFYVKEMPEVSVEGGFRPAPLLVRGLELEHEASIQEGCCNLRFTLPKGSYATVLLRELMKPSDPAASGL